MDLRCRPLRAAAVGVRSESRAEKFLGLIKRLLARIEQPFSIQDLPSPTLPIHSPMYRRYRNGRRIVQLGEKPDLLQNAGTITKRVWKRYERHLETLSPVGRADLYRRLMERKGCRSIRALARETGEDWSRVARILKVLELPEPVLDHIRAHDTPETRAYFTEKRLHQLVALRDSRKIWTRFQAALGQLERASE